MASLIKLTKENGKQICINPDYIVVVDPLETKTVVYVDSQLGSLPDVYDVKEPVNEIIWLMKNS